MNAILIAGNGYDMLKAYYAILRALYKYSWYIDKYNRLKREALFW